VQDKKGEPPAALVQQAVLGSPNTWVAWATYSRDYRAGASLRPATSKLAGS